MIYASDAQLNIMEDSKIQGIDGVVSGTVKKAGFASKMQQEQIEKKIEALFDKEDHQV